MGQRARASGADGRRYTVLRVIGRGGMGTVYVARDETLGREVAFKVSNAPASGSGLDERLRREARVLATLDHPGIAPVHDAGVLADGRLFYVMKLVRGVTLESHARGLDTESLKLSVFERVAETVAFAHARHRAPRSQAVQRDGGQLRRSARPRLGRRQSARRAA